jgi:hypothetical protein
MRQLEAAFERVAGRRDPVEGVHFGVRSLVQNARFALDRDFPGDVRHRGEERFWRGRVSRRRLATGKGG